MDQRRHRPWHGVDARRQRTARLTVLNGGSLVVQNTLRVGHISGTLRGIGSITADEVINEARWSLVAPPGSVWVRRRGTWR